MGFGMGGGGPGTNPPADIKKWLLILLLPSSLIFLPQAHVKQEVYM